MKRAVCIVLALLPLWSCSTTRCLAPGEYRLARNEIKVDDSRFATNELMPYVRQQAKGWTPFLNVYNWSDGSDSAFSRFCRKLGTPPVVFNENLVLSSKENITNHLEHLGYYGSKVEAEEVLKGRNVTVIYNVSLGRRIRIGDVRFDIPEGGDFEEAFLADSVGMLVKPGKFLSERLLEAESERSAANMRNQGFYGFSKINYSFVADTLDTGGTAVLDYQVRDYPRGSGPDKSIPLEKYRFGDVTITIDDDIMFRDKVLKNLNCITPGAVYNEEAVNRTYSRFASLQAFSSVNVRTSPTDSNTVDCNISLNKGKLKGFKVNLEGSVTATGLIGISPQVNFYHKNLFHGGEWFNMGFTGAFQFKPKDKLSANEFGFTTSISLPEFLFFHEKRVKSTAVPRTEFKLSYNFQDRPEYTRHVVSASMGYLGRIRDRFIFQLYPLQLSYVKLVNISDEFRKTLIENPYLSYSYSDHFDAGVGGTLYYSTDMDIVPKKSFWYSRFNFDASGNILGLFRDFLPKNEDQSAKVAGAPFSQYVKGEFNIGKTWRFGARNGQALATRFSMGAGYAYGNSVTLPYEKQFFVGGASSMRGWQARSVGPGFAKPNKYTLLPSQTGDIKIEADIEYRMRLFWKLEGALFAEVGNVWSLPPYGVDPIMIDDNTLFHFNNFYKSLAADWGAGLRVNLDFIVLRLDLGLKVHDPSRDEGSRWLGPGRWFSDNGFALHFGVGYPF